MALKWTPLGLKIAKHSTHCLPDWISKNGLYCLCKAARLLKGSQAWGQWYITPVSGLKGASPSKPKKEKRRPERRPNKHLSTCADFSSAFKLLISLSFISTLASHFPWNVRILLLRQKSNKYQSTVQKNLRWEPKLCNRVGRFTTAFNTLVPYWRLPGMSSSYLLLLNAFYLGLKLKRRRRKCELLILKMLRLVETYLLLSTIHGLRVLLGHCLTLMLQPLLTRKTRQNQIPWTMAEHQPGRAVGVAENDLSKEEKRLNCCLKLKILCR